MLKKLIIKDKVMYYYAFAMTLILGVLVFLYNNQQYEAAILQAMCFGYVFGNMLFYKYQKRTRALLELERLECRALKATIAAIYVTVKESADPENKQLDELMKNMSEQDPDIKKLLKRMDIKKPS